MAVEFAGFTESAAEEMATAEIDEDEIVTVELLRESEARTVVSADELAVLVGAVSPMPDFLRSISAQRLWTESVGFALYKLWQT